VEKLAVQALRGGDTTEATAEHHDPFHNFCSLPC
jgi:hypothetical protein